MLIKGLRKQIKKARLRRVRRVRTAIIAGALARSDANRAPRLSVYRSNQHIAAQVIDDVKQITLASASDKGMKGTKLERAQAVGASLAQLAVKKKINHVVFDRGWYRFHGRVKALADGAKKGGLQF